MMPFIRYVPLPDDACNVQVRDLNRPLHATATKPCGKRAVAVLKIRSEGSDVVLRLCARHAAELASNLTDAFHDALEPSSDFPPGTEMPGF